VWSPKGTTLRVIRCPSLQVSQFLFPGQRSDTFLTDHVYMTLAFLALLGAPYIYDISSLRVNRAVTDLHNSRRVEAHLPAVWSGIGRDSHKILKWLY